MIQISLRDITVSYSSAPLITGGNLYIEQGERVTLIGRNGMGKSTLLKLISGEIQPDEGLVEKNKSLKLALLPQAVPDSIPGNIKEIVASNLANKMDTWQVDKILSKLELDGEKAFNDLSGGLKRLVLLACLLVKDPDVLLLDEPTNHLDIDKISLLEHLLVNFHKTIIFVTHDRSLLQKLATHIVEIDNQQLISWKGHYQDYLSHKETLLQAELKANALFDKKLAEEERWIRQGIKARRTRNEGRVRQLKKMREERAKRTTRPGQVKLTQKEINPSGKIVFDVKNISFSYKDKDIVKNFSTRIQRGDKVGIIGKNGVGKSTLINILLGNLSPSAGSVEQGTKIEVGYFDQHRAALNDEQTLYEALSEIGETIYVNGRPIHIISYLQDFLFPPHKTRILIKNLSGGERNRAMLAKIFSKPCNVLVLDEPTNDLDIETLELLEEKLLEFSGTILLISHDRTFLNNVVTSTLVFYPEGKIEEYIGGYDDWLNQSPPNQIPIENTFSSKQKISEKKTTQKLSYKEAQELKNIPLEIERLEKRQSEINASLADPAFYKDHAASVPSLKQELINIDKKLNDYFVRWEELDKKQVKNTTDPR